MKRNVLVTTLALGLVAMAAAGCAGLLPRSAPSQFYVLSVQPAGGSEAALAIALGVGPVQLPGYLDRPQIVTRVGPNEVRYAETHRWASPLQQGVVNVLLADLGSRLRTDRLAAFPFALGLPRDYDVSVEFFHFEPSSNGEVLIEAIWRISDGSTGDELLLRRASLSRSAPAGDFAATTGALSDALGELADQIAAGLREIHARR
jgi:hypothetical protein